MKRELLRPAAYTLLFLTAITIMGLTKPRQKTPPQKNIAPKIQVAILLDVSNSMDGLIEQAKAQLWNMVSTMGKAQCNDQTPKIEIALYEYGRSTNDKAEGYVKQINGFTGDLDQLSKKLFNLTTNGGDEYCGHVIYTSLKELNWDSSSANYKVIFIAGNEDFLQGDILYTKACEEAKKKGVIVNTIYCGDKMQGIQEHWNLNAECGTGSFTNINQDEKTQDIPTPYDSVLYTLNGKLNGTYLNYGTAGRANIAMQADVDNLNKSMGYTVAAKRISVKGNGKLYRNSGWDLVDAVADDKTAIAKLDMKTLPDSLQKKSREEIKLLVDEKTKERGNIQQEITSVNTKREAYIAAEKVKNATKNRDATLETEVEKIIKVQAKRYNMIIQ